MTPKTKTRKALNEYVLTAGLIGGALLANKFLSSGEKKGTGFRYRVGQRLRGAFEKITPITDKIQKNIGTPWAQEILQQRQEQAHQDLANAFGIKPQELYRHLQSHAQILSVAPAQHREILRKQQAAAEERKTELTKKLYDFHNEKAQLIKKKNDLISAGHAATHTSVLDVDKKLRLNAHNIISHTFGNIIIDEVDASGNPTGNKISNLNLRMDPKDKSSPSIQAVLQRAQTAYRNIHGQTVTNPETGKDYTYGDITANTKLENMLAASPSAASTFASIKKYVLEPTELSIKKLDAEQNTDWAKIRADRSQKIKDDLARQKAAMVMTPPKSVTQSGIPMRERLKRATTRLVRNKLIDKLRTSL